MEVGKLITQKYLKSLFDYDLKTGIFTNKRGKRVGHIVSTKTEHLKYWKIYVNVPGIGPKKMAAHRLAWLYVYGNFPINEIDHIDRNGLNNSISNLRDVTRVENCANRKFNPDKVYRGGVPPNNKGKRTSKVAIKMRTAIINRAVETKGTVLFERFGGSKGTAQRVLQQLVTEKVLYQDPKSKRYKYRSLANG